MTIAGLWRSPAALRTALGVFLSIIVTGSVLALGTVHKPVLLGVGALVLLALVLARRLAALEGVGRVHGVSIVLLLLATWSFIQSLPLPLSVLQAIAPANADVWARALLPLSETNTHGALSLDPGASRIEALRFAIYAGVFHLSMVLANRRSGALVVTIVFASAALVALAQLAHGLVGATRVFGIYTPGFPVEARHMGPLLNGNNLSGYMNMGAIAGAGLLVSRRRSVSVWLLAVGVALIVAASVRAASRGGAVALPVGLLGLAIVQFARRRRATVSHRDTLFAGGMVVAAVALGGVLVVLAGVDDVLAELGSVNLQKLTLQRASFDLLRDTPWVGVGRGAFETAFGPYRPSHIQHVVFTHPENFLLQGLVEWGAIATTLALAAIGWMMLPWRTGAFRSVIGVASFMAVAAFMLQNLGDLGTEIPGLAVAATALLAVAVSGKRPAGRSRGSGRPFPRLGVMTMAGAVAVGLLLVADPAVGTVAADRHRVRAQIADVEVGAPQAVDAAFGILRSQMLAHPGDPYFPILGGAIAARANRPALPWIQRALERGPREGRAHLLLANYLERQGARGQSLLHLRLAAELEPPLAQSTARAAARLVVDRADVEAAVPPGKDGLRMLDELAGALAAAKRFKLAALCDDIAVERDPKAVKPRARRASRLVDALERGLAGAQPAAVDEMTSATCIVAQPACHQLLDAELRALEASSPGSSLAPQLRARWLAASGQSEEALALLREACRRAEGSASCLALRFSMAVRLGDPEALEEAQRDYLTEACARASSCASAWEKVADARAARGELNAAVAALTRSVREEETAARWSRLAEVATAAGAHAKALEALEAMVRLIGEPTPEALERLETARSRAAAAR